MPADESDRLSSLDSLRERKNADVLIIGAGPAGLMAAETIAAAGHKAIIIDRMPSPARKFLIAGRGGLNLTHAEPFERVLTRYRGGAPQLLQALQAFPPDALRAWADRLGAETFVGSSGRVFPRAMKASPLLRAWLGHLADLGVTIETRTRWTGWDESGQTLLTAADGTVSQRNPGALILALGGASWPRLGSDGAWANTLNGAGHPVAPLRPANAGLQFPWSQHLKSRFPGAPLKRIAVSVGDGAPVRGEAVLTSSGLEGGAIYAIFPDVRDSLDRGETPEVVIDLRPDLTLDQLAARLARPRDKQSVSDFLRRAAQLSPVAIALLREVATSTTLPTDPAALATAIKAVRLRPVGTAGLARAISTAGGVPFAALDGNLMLASRPGVFVCGEMLDWEAPTGGYLLQASFATGRLAATGALAWLAPEAARASTGTGQSNPDFPE